MTEREKLAITDAQLACFSRAGWRCESCGHPVDRYGTPQMAHRIPQNTRNLRRYGKRIIHHPLNTAATCCLECNAAMSIGGKPLAIAALVKQIDKCLQGENA